MNDKQFQEFLMACGKDYERAVELTNKAQLRERKTGKTDSLLWFSAWLAWFCAEEFEAAQYCRERGGLG